MHTTDTHSTMTICHDGLLKESKKHNKPEKPVTKEEVEAVKVRS